MGSGSGESPWVSSERSGHMPCVRAAGLIQELSAPPREVSDALIYKPTGSCPAPASHMQEKAHRSQDKQSQQHPCTAGGSTERAKDAPAGPPGPGGQRWPCPGTTAPGPGSNSTGCHGIHAAALRVPAVQGPLGAGGGTPVGSRILPPVQGMLLVPKGREGCEFPQLLSSMRVRSSPVRGAKRAAPGCTAPALAPAPSSVATTGLLSACARDMSVTGNSTNPALFTGPSPG